MPLLGLAVSHKIGSPQRMSLALRTWFDGDGRDGPRSVGAPKALPSVVFGKESQLTSIKLRTLEYRKRLFIDPFGAQGWSRTRSGPHPADPLALVPGRDNLGSSVMSTDAKDPAPSRTRELVATNIAGCVAATMAVHSLLLQTDPDCYPTLMPCRGRCSCTATFVHTRCRWRILLRVDEARRCRSRSRFLCRPHQPRYMCSPHLSPFGRLASAHGLMPRCPSPRAKEPRHGDLSTRFGATPASPNPLGGAHESSA